MRRSAPDGVGLPPPDPDAAWPSAGPDAPDFDALNEPGKADMPNAPDKADAPNAPNATDAATWARSALWAVHRGPLGEHVTERLRRKSDRLPDWDPLPPD
jgi:hypothetical protein